MQRRSVLKAFAALPFTTILGGCDEKTREKTASGVVEVHLEGAFALVIQENRSNSMIAFSPRPAKEDEPHQFYFNGSPKAEDPKSAYHFKLSLGREREAKPEISPGLKDFSFRTERWHVGDSLATIELPAPRRITFSGHRSPVTFLSDHRRAFLATNHILEYEVDDARGPKLECSDPGLRCDPAPDSFPGVTRFFFEIGPKRTLDTAQSHAHAIKFFNYILRQSFPDLEDKYKLAPEYPGKQGRGDIPAMAVPVALQYGAHGALLQNASYAVDCEVAGPLVSTHTAPIKP
jgi:hypothetical protein